MLKRAGTRSGIPIAMTFRRNESANRGGLNGRGSVNIFPKAALIFLVAVSAFNLGRYSVEFSGSTAGWVALVLSVLGLAVCAFALLFRDRKA